MLRQQGPSTNKLKTISYVLTRSQTLCSAIFGSYQVAGITVQLRQLKHCIRHRAVVLPPSCELPGFF